MRHPEPFFHKHLTHLQRLYRPTLRYWRSPFDFIPLLDILFLLAGFILVGQSNLVRFGIPMTLPSARTAEPIPFNASVLSVSSELMYLDNRWITSAGLPLELRQIAVQSTNSVLIIEADQVISHGELVRLYNTAREAGLHDIRLAALMTEPPAIAPVETTDTPESSPMPPPKEPNPPDEPRPPGLPPTSGDAP